MNHSLSATERVINLLRTIDEAREAWDTRSSGGGAFLMPSVWHEGSYVELERCLLLMREGGPDQLRDPVTGRATFGEGGFPVEILRPAKRQLWWHTVMRYRYGAIRTQMVSVRRTRMGAELVPPPRSEIVAGSAVLGDKNAVARVYTWSEYVNPALATEGVCHLTSLMHGGQDARIQLPVSVLRRVLGLPVEQPNEHLEAVAA